MRLRISHVAVVATLWAAASFAASARGTTTATVGGKMVTIDYGRPALKGRSLADLLKQLSEDRVWRAGDDQVTTLTTGVDLDIGGKRIKAGKYSLYVHLPEDGSRNLVLNTDLGQPLGKIFAQAPPELKEAPWPYIGNYQEKIGDKEILRAAMKRATVPSPVDVFTIELTPKTGGASLRLTWGDESWTIDLNKAM
jgi:hypothetical protein